MAGAGILTQRSQGPTFGGRRCGAMMVLAGALVAAAPAWAAPPVGASASTALQRNQEQLQQLDQQAQQKQRGPVVITGPLNRAGLPPHGGPRVVLKSVDFEPKSAFLTEAQLDAIVAPYIGHKVDFADLSSIVRDVNDLYAKAGIVTASAVLPPQKLAGGHLKVDLVEGRLGKVAVVGEHRTSDKYLFNRVHLATEGNVVDVPSAARDITYFNKTNRAQLRLALQPGAAFGLTDLALGITEPKTNQLQFFLDNEGVESTGSVEWGGLYQNYGPLGIDDSLMVYVTGSAGSLAGTVNYDLPVSTSGTRLAVSYSRSAIKVINGPQAALDVTGASQAGTVTVSQPLIATTNWTLLALASGSYGVNSSHLSGVPLVDSSTTKAVLGFSLTYSDDTASFTVQPQMVYARARDYILNEYDDIVLAIGTVNATVKFPNNFTLLARGAYQYTGTQLLPGDLLFQIGGPSTVRGYSTDGVAGDSGYYAQVELHKNLTDKVPGLDVFGFADVGEVFSTFSPQIFMASGGAGLSYNWNDRLTGELSAGVPLVNAMSGQPGVTFYARLTANAL